MRRKNEMMPSDAGESIDDKQAASVATTTAEQNSDRQSAARICSGSSAHVLVILLMALSAVVVLEVQYNWTSSTVKLWNDLGYGGGGPKNASRVDVTLGGLLPSMKKDGSCFSRFQASFYRKASKHNPSSYLRDRLRRYEALHKRCAPHTESYNKSIHQLKVNGSTEAMECKYVVWVPFCGMGNRILSIASAFMYALLTNRVLLVKIGPEMVDLFCEPFPEGTWVLPKDFPYIDEFGGYYKFSKRSYATMINDKVVIDGKVTATSTSPFQAPVVIYLAHDSANEDQRFFNEQDQQLLEKFPLIVISSNLYFVPSLFTVPKFGEEMSRLFPDRDVVFYHLGRYLFHPTNSVWGLITRYYQAYLAKADERIGIQIRTFGPLPLENVSNQISSCLSRDEVLPNVDVQQQVASTTSSGKLRSVLLTYLGSQYLEKMRTKYWEHPTENGDIIGIYQPSHEDRQRTENQAHNKKALAEIYLLSLMDVLVISWSSTFGYVAQGLGGLEPWIMLLRASRNVPDPPCRRLKSSEPCNLTPPGDRRGAGASRFAHIRTCEDNGAGIKLTKEA